MNCGLRVDISNDDICSVQLERATRINPLAGYGAGDNVPLTTVITARDNAVSESRGGLIVC